MSETLYFVETHYKRRSIWIERHDDDVWTRRGLIDDIMSGEIEDVKRILEVIPDEFSCRDITDDVARHIFDTHSHEPFANHVADFIEKHLPDSIAVQLRRAA